MSTKKAKPIDEKDLKDFKYFKVICRLLERLHQVGCQRPPTRRFRMLRGCSRDA
jgi:hypothetical protein